jgi:hypothetical protein
VQKLSRCRVALGALFALAPAIVVSAALGAAATPAHAAVRPSVNSHWTSCNEQAVKSAPKVVWEQIEAATTDNKDIPSTFWSNRTYRQDITKIVCYESSYDLHATSPGGQYGWYQMSKSLISSEHVTWDDYWDGSKTEGAGWYQCLAGERYIAHQYGTPAAAWQHEKQYGWY